MINLITNAYQAMPDGGTLTIDASQKKGYVCLRIEDTGTGIAPENLDKLFEPLFTTKSKGIGLGLTVSKTLVEANNGRISIKSEVGKGTEFVVCLPKS